METAFAELLSDAPVFVRRMDGEILYWTSGASELYGFCWSEAVGRSSHDLLKTVFPEPLDEINERLRKTNRWRGLLRHTRRDGAHIWTETQWRLREHGSDQSAIVIESNTDVTHRETLTRELDHRVKNTLALVQALARMSMKSVDPAVFDLFDQRLRALSEAHAILLKHHWADASLREVMERTLRPFGFENRILISGEDVKLGPSSVLAYSLAFHELAVNAVKYGSLSAPNGRVEIVWTVTGNAAEIHLFWRERGGPPPAPERRPGFGMTLLEKVLAAELGTPVNVRFEPEGLVCEFDGPTQKAPALGDEDSPSGAQL